MSYLASELVGWGMLSLFNLLYFGTAVYGIHDMFYGKTDNSSEEDLVCPVTGTRSNISNRSSYE